MAAIVRPQREKKLPMTMKYDEAQRMLQTLQTETYRSSKRDFVLITFVIYTGVRRQELVDLSWRDYDAGENVVLIHGKGKKERLVPLHVDLVAVLNEYRSSLPPELSQGDQPIFPNRQGKRMSVQGAHRIMKKALRLSNLPNDYSLYKLRHTFATTLLNQDADLKTIQELLGHESLATTETYTRTNMSRKRKAVAKLSVLS